MRLADIQSRGSPDMQIIRNRRVFDVCIVGSGAGGGMAALDPRKLEKDYGHAL